jgi:hypothetical protein
VVRNVLINPIVGVPTEVSRERGASAIRLSFGGLTPTHNLFHTIKLCSFYFRVFASSGSRKSSTPIPAISSGSGPPAAVSRGLLTASGAR